MKTFKQWILKKYTKDELAELAKYGANEGFPGLSYYTETMKLYQKHQAEIWNMLCNDADAYDITVLDFISDLTRSKEITCHRSFANLLVWYAAEKIAYEATSE